MPKTVAVIGSDIYAAQCALTLAELGLEVDLIASGPSLILTGPDRGPEVLHQELHLWPLLLKASSHPAIRLHPKSAVHEIAGKSGKLKLKGVTKPRFVNPALCTGCGDCEAACSVKVQVQVDGRKVFKSAIHSPLLGAKSSPSAYYIEKEGISPCRATCPLGINVQGFIALLGKGKVDKALALINESAPMASVLGRLCTHPCESQCSRQKVDSPVFIQALHRFCADHADKERAYLQKAPKHSKKDKIAIVGSGPSGLAAAWELARRGYLPTVFESHAVVGGMLATGIPRFRLPREVREKEVESIRAMGVDFKTGVTVGRDVTYTDLLERGYKAFYLAIGAQQNNRLGVPGEDLKGVLDAISLLFALNIHVEDTVGSDVIVVGGGNSAVDSARSARRICKGQVRILCLTEQMTAVKEDVDEAVREGVIIDYNVTVKEILGQDGNVTGVRCQKVKNVRFEADGKIKMEHLPDSEFILNADRVVIAIGQRPASAALKFKGLNLRRNATVEVDPVTLQTSLEGVFAGGDAVTGSNNVVESMAGGIRAAESIDRFLSKKDLHKSRSIERPVPVEPDIQSRQVSAHKRANMPNLPLAKRRHTYEETNLGLREAGSQGETERCLNCAVCSECLECEEACKLKAIVHSEVPKAFEIDAAAVLNFGGEAVKADPALRDNIYDFKTAEDQVIHAQLSRASALALTVALDLDLKDILARSQSATLKTAAKNVPGASTARSTSVFLCQCGESVSSVIDFPQLAQELTRLTGVVNIHPVSQACTVEGADQIKALVERDQSHGVVLAACRCCNLDQICFSCSDRRIMCQNNLRLDLPEGLNLEFANIREQCAWVHKDNPAQAALRAVEIIHGSIEKVRQLSSASRIEQEINPHSLVISAGIAGLAAAEKMVLAGQKITLFHHSHASLGKDVVAGQADIAGRLKALGVPLHPWPDAISVEGIPGSYKARFTSKSGAVAHLFGVIILDLARAEELKDRLGESDLLSRVLKRQNWEGPVSRLDSTLTHSFTIRETAGIFILLPYEEQSASVMQDMGAAAAARAAAYLREGLVRSRTSSVTIRGKFCRGCGDCAKLCSYIEMKDGGQGLEVAEVDPALCFGCGACVSICPTGAILQPLQSELGLKSVLSASLTK